MLQFRPNRIGNMKLDLKRLFARSMTGGLDLVGAAGAAIAALGGTSERDVHHAGRGARHHRHARRRLLLRDAAGDLADRGRAGQQRRPQGGAGADARPSSRPTAISACGRSRPTARPRARRRSRTARPISPSSAAISTCRKMRRPWRRCARTSRCCGCRHRRRARARRPVRRSPRLRSSPDTASASSAAPRPMSICSR